MVSEDWVLLSSPLNCFELLVNGDTSADSSDVSNLSWAQDKLDTSLESAEVSPLTNNSKQFNGDDKSTQSSETITKVYRGVEYQVQK